MKCTRKRQKSTGKKLNAQYNFTKKMRKEQKSSIEHTEMFYKAHNWNPKRWGKRKWGSEDDKKAKGQKVMVRWGRCLSWDGDIELRTGWPEGVARRNYDWKHCREKEKRQRSSRRKELGVSEEHPKVYCGWNMNEKENGMKHSWRDRQAGGALRVISG